ncbi:MAG TPA: hypothetical protein VH518_03415, partial [Tepidisphaeraceae bacterium]
DVINHIAPPFIKAPEDPKKKPKRWDEVPLVKKSGWIQPGEQMDEEYLRYIVTEKNYGVKLAEESLQHIEAAEEVLSPEDFDNLYRLFQRTLLTARLHRAVASAYYGYRVWYRGKDFQTQYVTQTTYDGLAEIKELAPLIKNYPFPVPKGQWDWRGDAEQAQTYFKWMTRGTWPKQSEKAANPYSGLKFPYP